MKLVFIGLSITSSWGNGHATTYRSLIRELAQLGHDILFLEKDTPYYASNRDMPNPPFCRTRLYNNFEDLERYQEDIQDADAVVVGSYVNKGVTVGRWVLNNARGITAFYDIDTPVTMAKLERQDYEYIEPELIAGFDMYLSFTGGPMLEMIEKVYGSRAARDLYCSVDPDLYYPEKTEKKWNLGYLGTYSEDRQPALDELLNKAARIYANGKFVVAGPQYPETVKWPVNVTRIHHLPPSGHRNFYNSQSFTLNITREDMKRAGYSPSVRLFEAAACGTPIISDYWKGLETLFEPGTEILISHSAEETVHLLMETPEEDRLKIGQNARNKTLKYHTARSRAGQLIGYINELREVDPLTGQETQKKTGNNINF